MIPERVILIAGHHVPVGVHQAGDVPVVVGVVIIVREIARQSSLIRQPQQSTDAASALQTAAQVEAARVSDRRDGTSGAKFAQLVGVKYQPFTSWVQQRRRQRKAAAKSQVTKSSASTVRWLEPVVAKCYRFNWRHKTCRTGVIAV